MNEEEARRVMFAAAEAYRCVHVSAGRLEWGDSGCVDEWHVSEEFCVELEEYLSDVVFREWVVRLSDEHILGWLTPDANGWRDTQPLFTLIREHRLYRRTK